MLAGHKIARDFMFDQSSVSLKGFFIVNPHIKKTYNGETFHCHCYNALRAKLTRRKVNMEEL